MGGGEDFTTNKTYSILDGVWYFVLYEFIIITAAIIIANQFLFKKKCYMKKAVRNKK